MGSNKKTVIATAGPSLALIKYWGKNSLATSEKQSSDRKLHNNNIPATTSIAITLDTLTSSVTIRYSKSSKDYFSLNNQEVDFVKVSFLQKQLQQITQLHHPYLKSLDFSKIEVHAKNNFPTAAGLASSSSGYAALSHALAAFYNTDLSSQELSILARSGSGSACRSVFEGFTVWYKNSQYAEPLAPITHWKDFRVIVVAPYSEKKNISSRDAMNTTASSSPYYKSWCEYNNGLVPDAIKAILEKDIEKIGHLTRLSYSAMHAAALATCPPILYFKPASILLIDFAATLRKQGIPIWETMDAGPQVKFITLEPYTQQIQTQLQDAFSEHFSNLWIRVCRAGKGSHIIDTM